MATAKPKTKRMMFGGMAAGVTSNVLKPSAPKPQSRFASASAKQTPNYAKPYVNKMQSRGALGGNQPPAGSNLMQAYNAQKSGKMGTGSQSAPNSAAIASIQRMKQKMGDPGLAMAKAQKAGMMKKGGAVKKATKK